MSDDDAKRAVLARRARFVAAAMAGMATASCDSCSRSQPCLSVSPTYVDASPPPGPCLSIAIMPTDAGEQTAIEGAGDAGDAGKDAGKKIVVGPPPPRPTPCLSAPPQPCLSPPPRVCLEPPF